MQGIPFPIILKNDIVNCFEYGMKMKTPSKIKLFLRFYKPVMLLKLVKNLQSRKFCHLKNTPLDRRKFDFKLHSVLLQQNPHFRVTSVQF